MVNRIPSIPRVPAASGGGPPPAQRMRFPGTNVWMSRNSWIGWGCLCVVLVLPLLYLSFVRPQMIAIASASASSSGQQQSSPGGFLGFVTGMLIHGRLFVDFAVLGLWLPMIALNLGVILCDPGIVGDESDIQLRNQQNEAYQSLGLMEPQQSSSAQRSSTPAGPQHLNQGLHQRGGPPSAPRHTVGASTPHQEMDPLAPSPPPSDGVRTPSGTGSSIHHMPGDDLGSTSPTTSQQQQQQQCGVDPAVVPISDADDQQQHQSSSASAATDPLVKHHESNVNDDGDDIHLCPLCRVYIKGYDHHCGILGSCIGRGNYTMFYLYLLTTSTACLSGAMTCVLLLIHRALTHGLLEHFTTQIFSNGDLEVLVPIVCAFSAFYFGGYTGLLFLFYSWQVVKGEYTLMRRRRRGVGADGGVVVPRQVVARDRTGRTYHLAVPPAREGFGLGTAPPKGNSGKKWFSGFFSANGPKWEWGNVCVVLAMLKEVKLARK